MKKLLISMLILSIAFTTSAQTRISVTLDLRSNAASGSKVLDTVTNAGTETLTSPVVKGTPYQTTIGFTATKLTGTVAGTATLQGSFDGTDWYQASSTTFTITDVAKQTTSWVLTNSPYAYYRVSVTGSGTSTYTIKSKVFTRN